MQFERVTTVQAILAKLGRYYPFFSGYIKLANHKLMRLALPENPFMVWAETPGGKVIVRLNDIVGRTVFLFGDYDPKITWVIQRLLKPGDTALDVGANIGLVSLSMSKVVRVRPSHVVIRIEISVH
jgi:hypothetical protein